MTTNELLELPVQYEYMNKLPMKLFVPGKEFDIIFNDESELPTIISRLYYINRSTNYKVTYERLGKKLHIIVTDSCERMKRIEQLLGKIESRYSIPPMKRGNGRPNKYNYIFNKMNEGDSIIVNKTDMNGIAVYTRKNNIKITRVQLDVDNTRVWKIKDSRTDVVDVVIDDNTFIVPIESNIPVFHMKRCGGTYKQLPRTRKLLDTLQSMNPGDSYVIVGMAEYKRHRMLLKSYNINVVVQRITDNKPYQYRFWKV
jgi:hypothetical protein